MGVRQRIKEKLLRIPLIFNIVEKSKKVVLPGFGGMPIYTVFAFFITEINKNSITTRAYAVAFQFFLAIFPGLIFLFSLIPYIPIENFQEQLLMLLHEILPKNAYDLTRATFEDLVKNPRGGLLSLGFVIAFYFAANGIHAIINAFNHSYHTTEKRGFIKQKLTSVTLVFILVILMILAITLIIFSGVAIKFLTEKGILLDDFSIFLLQAGQWLIILLLFFLAISFLYYLGPSKKVRFKFINPGSSLATLLCILTSLGFTFYVNNFGQYNKLYGSIGTIMVIMLWIYFNSLILLTGFELNASIYLAKQEKLKQKKANENTTNK